MGEHAARGPELTKTILDQTHPLSEFSCEDRLRAVLFHMRARAGADENTFRRTSTVDLGIPEPVVSAVVHGDIHALRAATKDHGRWPILASLFAYGGGLAADYGSLAAALAEYEEIMMPVADRRLLPVSRTMLERRGYAHSAESFLEDPTEAATDPRQARTHLELIEALECLRIRAGNPSLREIADRSAHIPKGVDPTKHEHRSYNTINKVLKAEAGGPPLIPVLAFVRGCGVTDPEQLAAWEAVCTRIAIAKRKAPASRKAGDQQGWRAPSGPNPSMA
ncbi:MULTISPECIES: hypothetical protein [Nocardiopsis]|uniref:Uncharacterized protein n=1 Tax=Nocardiopsis sinuspersici TaxID=501010 RepID=A0A1V3BVP4_9ACTN|nr:MULTISPECIES: hypothetical protein [Nocardiopsis]OOC52433.1 hypothetical protein NOSIN_00110 [Nocardiopsis sinuspersici]